MTKTIQCQQAIADNNDNAVELFESKEIGVFDSTEMDCDSEFEMKRNKNDAIWRKRIIYSPYKAASGVLDATDAITQNSSNLEEISQKLDQILKNQNQILTNQKILIDSDVSAGDATHLQPQLDFSTIVTHVDFGPDFINPNYSNFKIKEKTLKAFAKSVDGKRTVRIRKSYGEENLFDFDCKACHMFGKATQNEANENYRKGFKLTKQQLEDPDEMNSKRKGLIKHFKHTEQHYRAELKYIEYKTKWKHELLLKMDVFYHLAINPTCSMDSFEGHMVIFYNEKKRSNCKCAGCCAIGTKQNSKDMVTRWRKLTYEYLNMQLYFCIYCLGSYKHNIVFFSVTMDGYDIGLCRLFVSLFFLSVFACT